MSEYHKVIVIGGGITGLTVAHHLNHDGIDVIVLEKENQPGGTMTTFRKDGWLVERGPNTGLETTPLFKELFGELGIRDQIMYANKYSYKRYILRNGLIHSLPMSTVSFLRTKLWSAAGKLRILKEPFIGKAEKEESISEFVTRRLGRELLDYAINPFVAGVFAGDPSRLSVRAAFPKLYALEEKYGGLIRGMILGAAERKRRAEKAKDRARQFSFTGGMQTLPDVIASKLGDRVCCGTGIRSIKKNPDPGSPQFMIETGGKTESRIFTADTVVLAVPSYIASGLIRDLDPSLSHDLDSIYYPPVAEVFLGYRKEQVGCVLDGFG